MTTTWKLIPALVLIALATLDERGAAAQTPRNVSLSEQVITGSRPYREAVTRYLQGQEPKILGGRPALAGEYPWQVSLGVSWIASPYSAHFCGGTIYSPNWIVTAAHCVEGTAPSDVTVTAGTHVLGAGGSRQNVRRIIVHADYKADTSDNDIALLELLQPLAAGQGIRSIPVVSADAETSLLQTEVPLVVVGWGATNEGGSKVRDLRFVQVPFVDRTTCNRPLAYDNRVTENMLCAGVAIGGKDACQGDSGGPLTVGTTSNPQLAGVVSWGEGCGRPNKVGVYTRAARYERWIAGCMARPNECR